MKLQFKHQKFQADAAKAVVDIFAGQPYPALSYMMDRGSGYIQQSLTGDKDFTGWSNQKILPELSDHLILEHIQKIRRANQVQPFSKLEGRSNGFNQPYFAGWFMPSETQKSPQNKAFYGHRATHSGRVHCVKDSVLLDSTCGSGGFFAWAFLGSSGVRSHG